MTGEPARWGCSPPAHSLPSANCKWQWPSAQDLTPPTRAHGGSGQGHQRAEQGWPAREPPLGTRPSLETHDLGVGDSLGGCARKRAHLNPLPGGRAVAGPTQGPEQQLPGTSVLGHSHLRYQAGSKWRRGRRGFWEEGGEGTSMEWRLGRWCGVPWDPWG